MGEELFADGVAYAAVLDVLECSLGGGERWYVRRRLRRLLFLEPL